MDKQNLKLVKTKVLIEGDDKERLKLVFDKIINGTIELNELKITVAYLGAICKTADLQAE